MRTGRAGIRMGSSGDGDVEMNKDEYIANPTAELYRHTMTKVRYVLAPSL
jgi:hypothetical protein